MTSHSSFDRALLPPAETFYRANVAKFRARGRRATGLCPFHPDKHPSLSIDLDRGLWNCFVCAEGGDIVRFVERLYRVDFLGALKILGCVRDVNDSERRAFKRQLARQKKELQRVELAERQERIAARDHLLAVKTLYEEAIAEHSWELMAEFLPRVRQAEEDYARLPGLELSYDC